VNRWLLHLLLSILLGFPALSNAAGDTPDLGKATMIDLELLKIPLGENPSSNAASEKKAEGQVSGEEKREKEALDKKVDDAIRKAWEEK